MKRIIIEGGRSNGKTYYQKLLNELNNKYEHALGMLVELYGAPCEMITKGEEFMNADIDRCSTACAVDDEVLRECWNRYIEKAIKEEKKENKK